MIGAGVPASRFEEDDKIKQLLQFSEAQRAGGAGGISGAAFANLFQAGRTGRVGGTSVEEKQAQDISTVTKLLIRVMPKIEEALSP